MRIQTKFLYDLGSRNTFQVLQEAGHITLWSILANIYDSDGQESVKKSKIVKIGSRKKTRRRQAHVPRAVFFLTLIYDLRCGQKSVKTLKTADFDLCIFHMFRGSAAWTEHFKLFYFCFISKTN